MLEELKERVCKANKQLRDSGLVILTWGNVSAIDREKGLMVIKPSGVDYDDLTPDKMVVVNMDGKVVEGDLNPSSDTPTHLILYQAFDEIGAVVHTHSRYATIWAQAGLDIVAYGTTHADYFYGDIPCTMQMTEEQIAEDYERNTGIAITDTFQRRRLGCLEMQACLVASHGPFVWGLTPEKAVENAVVLEEIAHMAVYNAQFQFGLTRISEPLLNKHYLRKHGENAYYGQTFGLVTDIVKPSDEKADEGEDIKIQPSKHTTALKNIDQIAEVERPVINKIPKKEESVFDIPENFVGETENMDIQPSEPDGIGDPLEPNDPEISLTMIAPAESAIPSHDNYTGNEPAKPYSPPKAEYKPGESDMDLQLVAPQEFEKRNAEYTEPETPGQFNPHIPDFKPEDIEIDLKPIQHRKPDNIEQYKEPDIPEPYSPPKPEYKPEEGGVELRMIKKTVYESQFGFNITDDSVPASDTNGLKNSVPGFVAPEPQNNAPEPVQVPAAPAAQSVVSEPEQKPERGGFRFTAFKNKKGKNKTLLNLSDTLKNVEQPKPAEPPEAPKPVEPTEPPRPAEIPEPAAVIEKTAPVETIKPAEENKQPDSVDKPVPAPEVKKENNRPADTGSEPLDFTF